MSARSSRGSNRLRTARSAASGRDNPHGQPRGQSSSSVRETSGSLAPTTLGRRRNFEYIASVSRSSGLERDGDALKDHKTQEEYRSFVEEKLDKFWKKYSEDIERHVSRTQKERVEVQENLLILFRKLREGISSSRRKDVFAIEVYETSLYLSVIFSSWDQTTSILSHLLPDLYASMPSLASASPPTHHTTMALALLHKLNASYPSQRAFLELLNDPIPSAPWIRLSATMNTWVRDVARCLRRNDYLTFNELTRRTAIPRLSCSSGSDSYLHISAAPDLARKALHSILASLRSKARISAWRVLRSAYPQFALPVGDTRTWLSRTLLLDHELATSGEGKDGQEGAEKLTESELELWFTEREKLREVGRKDGSEGRWVVEMKR